MLKREALAKLYATKQGRYRWNKWSANSYIYYCTRYNMICWDNGRAYDTAHGALDEPGWEEYKEPVIVIGLESLFKKHKELGKQKTYGHCSSYDTGMYVETITSTENVQQLYFDTTDETVSVDSLVAYATYTMVER